MVCTIDAKAVGIAGRKITVRFGADEVEFKSIRAVVEHATAMIDMVGGARRRLRDERLRIGHLVATVQAQLDHGEKLEFLERLSAGCGLSPRYLRQTRALAVRVCDRAGAISGKKLRKCLERQGSNWHLGANLKRKAEALRAGKLVEWSYRDLEEIAGIRANTRTRRLPSAAPRVGAEPEHQERAGVAKEATPVGGAGREEGVAFAETGGVRLRPPPATCGEATERRSDGATKGQEVGTEALARTADVVGQIGMGSLYQRAVDGLKVAARMVDDVTLTPELRAKVRGLLEDIAALVGAVG